MTPITSLPPCMDPTTPPVCTRTLPTPTFSNVRLVESVQDTLGEFLKMANGIDTAVAVLFTSLQTTYSQLTTSTCTMATAQKFIDGEKKLLDYRERLFMIKTGIEKLQLQDSSFKALEDLLNKKNTLENKIHCVTSAITNIKINCYDYSRI